MIHSSEVRLFDLEMRYRFNPPDHPLVLLSLLLMAGSFILFPIIYPDQQLSQAEEPYVRLMLGSMGGLVGIWVIILALLMLIDRLAHRPTYPSEEVAYRPWYYTYKYFNWGCFMLGIALSGLVAVARFFQSPFLTLFYGFLLCFQGGYVLRGYKRELLILYGAYSQINLGRNSFLPYLGLFVISILRVISYFAGGLNQPLTTLFFSIVYIWGTWYFLRLAVLNFVRAGLHAGIGKNIVLRSEYHG
ncbi:MAG: hypothetical protein JXA33_27195 [Anaerolineae bacterium]|nr:hypothetical protein [Anaerolineae bacterium]